MISQVRVVVGLLGVEPVGGGTTILLTSSSCWTRIATPLTPTIIAPPPWDAQSTGRWWLGVESLLVPMMATLYQSTFKVSLVLGPVLVARTTT